HAASLQGGDPPPAVMVSTAGIPIPESPPDPHDASRSMKQCERISWIIWNAMRSYDDGSAPVSGSSWQSSLWRCLCGDTPWRLARTVQRLLPRRAVSAAVARRARLG
ncbi:MAG: hypothetical protein NTZ05_11440, partial [Chloroflexi bacterium]|nr:hypothetical protein [Chloroflexota bacterium]